MIRFLSLTPLFRGVIGKRESPNCFNSFATSTKRETVKTVAIDLSFTNTQLKLGVNEKLLSNPVLQVTRNQKPTHI